MTLPSTPFVTLDELKAYLSITNSNYDALLTEIRDTVSELIVDFCDTTFEEETIENEIQDGRKSDIILTDRCPIIEVTALKLNVNPDGTGGLTLVANQDYIVRPEEIALRYQFTPQGRGLVRIDYKAGYTTVPNRVKFATKIASQGYFQLKTKNLVGVISKSKEGESINYKDGWSAEFGLPNEVVSMLSEYRSIEWPSRSTMATRNY